MGIIAARSYEGTRRVERKRKKAVRTGRPVRREEDEVVEGSGPSRGEPAYPIGYASVTPSFTMSEIYTPSHEPADASAGLAPASQVVARAAPGFGHALRGALAREKGHPLTRTPACNVLMRFTRVRTGGSMKIKIWVTEVCDLTLSYRISGFFEEVARVRAKNAPCSFRSPYDVLYTAVPRWLLLEIVTFEKRPNQAGYLIASRVIIAGF